MYKIDFLPEEFHRRAVDRRWHRRLAVLLAAYSLVTAAVWIYQTGTLQALGKQQEALKPEFAESQQIVERHAALSAELQQANDWTELVTYLRHPWPRTQILSAIFSGLPDNVYIDEISINNVRRDAGPSSGQLDGREAEATTTDARGVLQRLRSENDDLRTVAVLRGVTEDSQSIHQYLRSIRQCPIVAKAERPREEAYTGEGLTDATTFEIQLEFLPGYGQPGGPQEKLPKSTEPATEQMASAP